MTINNAAADLSKTASTFYDWVIFLSDTLFQSLQIHTHSEVRVDVDTNTNTYALLVLHLYCICQCTLICTSD